MSYELTGKIHKIFPTESKGEAFTARDFVIQTYEQYPQLIKFQLSQDRCKQIDNMSEGDKVTVHFNLKGKEWQGKYFTNLNAWRIQTLEKGAASISDVEDAEVEPW